MACRKGDAVLGIAAAAVLAAASPAPAAIGEPDRPGPSPAHAPDTRYCLRLEAFTGSRIQTVECWTRRQWAEQEVDVDSEWAKEGVAVLKAPPRRWLR